MTNLLHTASKAYYPGYDHPIRCIIGDSSLPIGPQACFRIVFLHEGTTACRCDGQTYPIAAPAILSLNHQASLELLPDIAYSTIYFHPCVVNDRFNLELKPDTMLEVTDYQDMWYLDTFLHASLDIVSPIDPAAARHISRLFADIDHQLDAQADAHWPCRSRSMLTELLAMLRRLRESAPQSADPIPSSPQAHIQPIIDYLHMNYMRKIRIEELTKQFHTNKTTLNARFKSATGLSVLSYLNSVRIRMASFMLRNTLLPTSEVRSRVGVGDDAHFIRMFRKYAGCSPSEFRNLHCRMLK